MLKLAKICLTASLMGSLLSTPALAKDPPARPSGEGTGITLTTLLMEPEAARVDGAVKLSVLVRNNTDKPCGRIILTLQVDGKKVSERMLFERLGPSGEKTLAFSWVPHQAGPHRLNIVLGTGTAEMASIHKDIQVAERVGYQLEVVHVEAPPLVRMGQDAALKVEIQNSGDGPAEEIRVNLVSEGRRLVIARVPQSLSPTGKCSVVIHWTPDKVGKRQFSIELEATGLGNHSGLPRAVRNADVPGGLGRGLPSVNPYPPRKGEAPKAGASEFSLDVIGQ